MTCLLYIDVQETFSGASSKQSTIVHTTLCRIVSDKQLPGDVITNIDKLCAFWTQKLEGRQFSPSCLWWIIEKQFSTIEGDREIMQLAQ